ncbi:MAG: hypothetical protein ACI9V1_000967 [Spirosomataceae bacterium]|jgi:hypothetical protein
MKIYLLLLTTVLTISCLNEKGGVIPIIETTSTGGDPTTTDPTSSLGAELCGISSTATGDVCFDTQILPMIVSNCAQSGCHDSKSKRDGYDLTAYDKIIKRGFKEKRRKQ